MSHQSLFLSRQAKTKSESPTAVAMGEIGVFQLEFSYLKRLILEFICGHVEAQAHAKL